MKNPSPGVKDIITPTEAIDYFVLSRRKFYDLLKSDKQKDFLVFYKDNSHSVCKVSRSASGFKEAMLNGKVRHQERFKAPSVA